MVEWTHFCNVLKNRLSEVSLPCLFRVGASNHVCAVSNSLLSVKRALLSSKALYNYASVFIDPNLGRYRRWASPRSSREGSLDDSLKLPHLSLSSKKLSVTKVSVFFSDMYLYLYILRQRCSVKDRKKLTKRGKNTEGYLHTLAHFVQITSSSFTSFTITCISNVLIFFPLSITIFHSYILDPQLSLIGFFFFPA